MTSPSANYQTLLIETTPEGVRTITINRPERLNAVNAELARELPDAVSAAGIDDEVRVLVITGAGRGFCVGLDLTGAPTLETSSRVARLDPDLWVGRWVHAVTRCEKPVIAAVNGPAAGAGFGLALCCDFRLVSASAKMTAGYIRRGLSPDAGLSWWLPRLVGHTRAMDIIMTGRDVSSAEAMQIGLATQVIPDEAFVATTEALAMQLAAGPPLAMALTKRLMIESASTSLDSQLRNEVTHIKTCFQTADVADAMVAFREKRMPRFTGR
ncbi:MAG: enoyl-CoA hydratase/isomerase family protein [Phycisphaerae bacterium]|nr:enoyl-CoA hydratase/isomerase family protein [Gemmatimonadaceae bacterium]